MSRPPVNLRKLSDAPAAVTTAVDYAVQVADGYLKWLRDAAGPAVDSGRQPLLGKRVLEIGPGETLGTAALLACAGGQVSVADRFLATWDPDFHPTFVAALLPKAEARGWHLDPLRRMLADGGFAAVIDCYPVGVERIIDIEGQFDVVLSNAVLEHIEDLDVAAANLAVKTVPGGAGFHQVDFRDHRDFDRPLEFLTRGEEDFDRRRAEAHCEWGTRWRAADVAKAFASVGFSVRASVNLLASADYVADVRPRLQPQYAALTDEELKGISALFTLTRTSRAKPHGVEPEFFIEAWRGVVDLADNACSLAERFRRPNLEPAQDALVSLTNELQLFATLVEALRGPLAIDPRLLTIDNQTPDEQLTRLAGQVQALIDAQLNADWLGVADILEFDLQPLVRPWAPRVLSLGKVA
jgi:hypothetical protein